MNTLKTTHKHEEGFTLIELSIVLVIIGLIVGGILVGQDMIKAAEIRATVAQFEKMNSAVNTFRDKYGAIPGDMGATKATDFGFPIPARTAAATLTDQDGRLECIATSCPAAAGIMNYGGETSLFWSDLSAAELSARVFNTTNGTIAGGAGAAITPGGVGVLGLEEHVPAAELGRGNYISVYTEGGINYYYLAGITQIANANGAYTFNDALSPQEAFNIDQKLDDEDPLNGMVRAYTTMGTIDTAQGEAAGVCVLTGGAYQTTTEAAANSPRCQLRVRFN